MPSPEYLQSVASATGLNQPAPEPVDLEELKAPEGVDQQSWERMTPYARKVARAKLAQSSGQEPRKPEGVSGTLWYNSSPEGKQQLIERTQKYGTANTGATPEHPVEQGILNNAFREFNDWAGVSQGKSGFTGDPRAHAQYDESGGQLKDLRPKEQPADRPAEKVEAYQNLDDDDANGQQTTAQPQAQWVEAHSEALANPEDQAALGNAIGKEANARLAAGDILAHGEEVGAEGQEQAAQQAMADQDQLLKNERARQSYLDRLGADLEADAKAMAESRIDPERFYKTRSTGQSIATLLGIALGGFVQGFKGGNNPASDMIENAIKEDIAAQRTDLESKWSQLRFRHSALADKAQRYNSLDIAEKQQVAARLQGAMMMAQAAAARATSPVERANAQALAAQLEQKAIEASIRLNKWVNAGYASAAGVAGKINKDIKNGTIVHYGDQQIFAGDPETARNVSGVIDASREVDLASKELLRLLDDPKSWMGKFSPNARAIGAASARLAQVDPKSLGSGTRGSLGVMRFIAEKQGDLTSFNPWKRSQAKQAVMQINNDVQTGLKSTLSQLGGNPTVKPIVTPDGQHFGYQVTGTFTPEQAAKPSANDSFQPASQPIK